MSFSSACAHESRNSISDWLYCFWLSMDLWKSFLEMMPLHSGSYSRKFSEDVRSLSLRNMSKNLRIISTLLEDSTRVSTICFPMVPFTTLPDDTRTQRRVVAEVEDELMKRVRLDLSHLLFLLLHNFHGGFLQESTAKRQLMGLDPDLAATQLMTPFQKGPPYRENGKAGSPRDERGAGAGPVFPELLMQPLTPDGSLFEGLRLLRARAAPGCVGRGPRPDALPRLDGRGAKEAFGRRDRQRGADAGHSTYCQILN
ncbi:hypothetical protein EYF80_029154 [Liparis tanakae]|uniref:Uncharacterized protein n=1 Tax=Liparis tanakae TaxID=230148 RepID=A0A4Z2H4X4_9TELE|nr:hypothetical protein EYF80_029154 [Liparis tanakae]